MKGILRNTKFLILALLLFFGAMIAEKTAINRPSGKAIQKRVQKVIHHKEYEITRLLEELPEDVLFSESIAGYHEYISDKISRKDFIDVFIYKDDNLLYWTNHTVPIKNRLDSARTDFSIIRLDNAWYLKYTSSKNRYKLHGLFRIKNDYPYENRFLQNKFTGPFKLRDDYNIVLNNSDNDLIISDLDGDFLFSIRGPVVSNHENKRHALLGLIYGFSLFFFLFFLHQFIHFAWFRWNTKFKIAIAIVALVIMRAVMLFFNFPEEVYHLSVFDPKLFAVSRFLPSLGDLLIHAIFLFFIVFEFFSAYRFRTLTKMTQKTRAVGLIVLLTVFYIYVHVTFGSLIYNSSISFEAYRVLDITAYSFIGIFILGLNFISLILLTEKTIECVKKEMKFIHFGILFLGVSFILFAVFLMLGVEFGYQVLLFFYVFTFVILFASYYRKKMYNFNGISILVILFSLYSVFFINNNAQEKEKSQREVLAIKLASEHDPVAEILLPDLESKIKNDTVVTNAFIDDIIDIEKLDNYLNKKYFRGFWSKYNIQTIICNPLDTIYIEPPDDMYAHCYAFFEKLIENEGIQLENSNFFFLDNLNGNISYFGAIEFIKDLNSMPVTLFIQLDSKLITKELGYPELLLDKKFAKESVLDNYSYAKYKIGALISKNGSFKYNLSQNFESDTTDFFYMDFEGYNHLIYNVDRENSIIISKPSLSFFNLLISFSYIFLFFYLLGVLVLLIIRNPMRKGWLRFNFKERIQFSMVLVLLLSLPILGGGTIYFSIIQYKSKHNEIIAEKIQSVYIELVHKLEFEEELTSDWSSARYDNLNQLMVKFSNVFYTDINLFDEEGNLLATSRSEVFNKGLIGKKMNIRAFTELSLKNRPEFIHRERIGKLNYLSGYVPFFNADGNLLAYLNLPYFTNQSALTNDISALVVAIVNIYVLLMIFTLSIAFLISSRLTQPLRFLQNKIREIDLGKSTLKIEYSKKDEIGSLVAEYNAKVEELNKNVELLAKSERESAWREMAKQIAHEIKNPLTPMKLNAQFLYRTLKGKDEEIDERLEKYTQALTEQINQLSNIATEFSNFAKMPKAKNEKMDLVAKLNNVADLFSNEEKANISLDKNELDQVYVFADKEQLLRVFVNLVKNAIQAIPDDTKGEIIISLQVLNDTAVVEVIDNGRGIPEELRNKLFQPNFTTKSSGMGLGLAIVKQIIEDSNGKIYFETELDKGTKFIVEFPLFSAE